MEENVLILSRSTTELLSHSLKGVMISTSQQIELMKSSTLSHLGAMRMVDLVNQAAKLCIAGDEDNARLLLDEAEQMAKELDAGKDFFFASSIR